MQSDMSLSNDTFTATISNQDAILRDLTFQIKVIPLIRRQEGFSVTENKMQLTQKHLDASHLAGKKSNSNLIHSDPF
jgi:predicted restriction endonuclease